MAPPAQFHALTGLRFVAACSVLLLHSGSGLSEASSLPSEFTAFLRHGYLGVCVFFVLSGFILTYTYASRLSSPKSYVRYFLARFARIYPLYLLALLIALPLPETRLNARDAAAVLLLVQSWGPAESSQGYAWVMQAWTLSVEFFFYLLLPLVLPIAAQLGKRTLITAAILLSPVACAEAKQELCRTRNEAMRRLRGQSPHGHWT